MISAFLKSLLHKQKCTLPRVSMMIVLIAKQYGTRCQCKVCVYAPLPSTSKMHSIMRYPRTSKVPCIGKEYTQETPSKLTIVAIHSKYAGWIQSA